MATGNHHWQLILCALLAPTTGALVQQKAPSPAGTPIQPAPTQSADVPRAVFIATMDAEFRRRDGNGDGMLMTSELQQFEAGEALAAARIANRDLFARLDRDGNGALSAEEFAALVGPIPPPNVSAQMLRLDSNRDQKVTIVEYRAATLAAFDRLDTDLDGVVTAAEMQAGKVAPAPSGR